MGKKSISPPLLCWLMAALVFSSACGSRAAATAQVSPAAEQTPQPKPTQTDISPPLPTFDAGVQPYLADVEDILRHSAVVIKDRAVGIPDACPDLYITAFPYSEPDRRGGMTLAVTALTRDEDGTIIMGEHQYLWNLKGEGMDPERCKEVIIQDRSEPGFIRLSFQVQDPADRSWRIGVASGPCPGIDLWLSGYFYLENPEDFQLFITRYSPEEPDDYWLRDGDQLLHYRWEPWEETLLWTLEDVPGTILQLEWSEDSPDVNNDGVPDLAITWNNSGSRETRFYSAGENGFSSLE